MSVQTMLTAALFKRGDDGRMMVFPNGAAGRGYIVPDAAMEQRMRRILMWWIIGAGAAGGIGSQVLGSMFGQPDRWTAATWALALAALALFALGYRAVMARLVRGLEPAPERLALIEALAKQAQAMPRWYLWALAICGPLMVLGSVIWAVAGASMASHLLGLVGTTLFATVTLQAIHGLARRPQT